MSQRRTNRHFIPTTLLGFLALCAFITFIVVGVVLAVQTSGGRSAIRSIVDSQGAPSAQGQDIQPPRDPDTSGPYSPDHQDAAGVMGSVTSDYVLPPLQAGDWICVIRQGPDPGTESRQTMYVASGIYLRQVADPEGLAEPTNYLLVDLEDQFGVTNSYSLAALGLVPDSRGKHDAYVYVQMKPCQPAGPF